MELCRPEIHGPVFYMDLDSLVVGDIAHFAAVQETTLLSDFYRPANLQSSLMLLTEWDRRRLWDAFAADAPALIHRYSARRVGLNGDQNFIEDVLGSNVQRWQSLFPGEVVSFKVNVRDRVTGQAAKWMYAPRIRDEVPPPIRLVVFHGNPRPWEIGL